MACARARLSIRSLAVARLDEAALRLERGDIGAGELLGDFGERRAAGGEALDQPLVDGLAFAVLLAAIGGGTRS